ncbi:MAG: hypothetical protein KF861_06450, partial [Planctomycetaceae bacterium]|nr:hypothetical protein [Planctomycetaceae bacterium]
PATQIARAVDWASVHLLSQIDPELVEKLFMKPLSNEQDGRRLVESGSTLAFVERPQFAHVHQASSK